jgi:hypothetical protein
MERKLHIRLDLTVFHKEEENDGGFSWCDESAPLCSLLM